MNLQEKPLLIPCEGDMMVGVLAQPEQPRLGVAVLLVTGGPQVRAGSHRQYVQLARELAAAGVPALRFDVRGMGDSTGSPRGFEMQDQDIAAAANALLANQAPGTKLVLWGLCDGASAALLYLDRTGDERVSGVALLNPWLRSERGLARVQVKHYYAQRLLQRDFWMKLARGAVSWRSVGELGRALGQALRRQKQDAATGADYRERMARQWHRFRGELLLLLSELDATAREFEDTLKADSAWRGALQREGFVLERLPDADHTLSNRRAKQAAHAAMLNWLFRLHDAREPGPAATESS